MVRATASVKKDESGGWEIHPKLNGEYLPFQGPFRTRKQARREAEAIRSELVARAAEEGLK